MGRATLTVTYPTFRNCVHISHLLLFSKAKDPTQPKMFLYPTREMHIMYLLDSKLFRECCDECSSCANGADGCSMCLRYAAQQLCCFEGLAGVLSHDHYVVV